MIPILSLFVWCAPAFGAVGLVVATLKVRKGKE